MKPEDLRRRALEVLDKAAEECPESEGVDLVTTAQQLLVAASDVEEMSEAVEPGTIKGERVGGEPADEAEHFYICPACGQAVDRRDLGAVLHHKRKDHEPLPTQ